MNIKEDTAAAVPNDTENTETETGITTTKGIDTKRYTKDHDQGPEMTINMIEGINMPTSIAAKMKEDLREDSMTIAEKTNLECSLLKKGETDLIKGKAPESIPIVDLRNAHHHPKGTTNAKRKNNKVTKTKGDIALLPTAKVPLRNIINRIQNLNQKRKRSMKNPDIPNRANLCILSLPNLDKKMPEERKRMNIRPSLKRKCLCLLLLQLDTTQIWSIENRRESTDDKIFERRNTKKSNSEKRESTSEKTNNPNDRNQDAHKLSIRRLAKIRTQESYLVCPQSNRATTLDAREKNIELHKFKNPR
jgi:hypothetical protein